MTLQELKNEIENYKKEVRSNLLTKQAKSDLKMLEMFIGDIDFLINNGQDKIAIEKLKSFNLGVYACEIAKLLVSVLDNKTYAKAYTNNHSSNNYNKVSNIKTYITSKPSAIGKEAKKYTYVYFVRSSFHGLVRFDNSQFDIGTRFVVSDIPNGKIIKQF